MINQRNRTMIREKKKNLNKQEKLKKKQRIRGGGKYLKGENKEKK